MAKGRNKLKGKIAFDSRCDEEARASRKPKTEDKAKVEALAEEPPRPHSQAHTAIQARAARKKKEKEQNGDGQRLMQTRKENAEEQKVEIVDIDEPSRLTYERDNIAEDLRAIEEGDRLREIPRSGAAANADGGNADDRGMTLAPTPAERRHRWFRFRRDSPSVFEGPGATQHGAYAVPGPGLDGTSSATDSVAGAVRGDCEDNDVDVLSAYAVPRYNIRDIRRQVMEPVREGSAITDDSNASKAKCLRWVFIAAVPITAMVVIVVALVATGTVPRPSPSTSSLPDASADSPTSAIPAAPAASPTATPCTVDDPGRIGNGWCDGGQYNTEECDWDGGDCTELNEQLWKVYPNCYGVDPSAVGDGRCHGGQYNTEECGWDGGDCVVEGFPDCHVDNPSGVGDGRCRVWQPYNTVECGWDGGDCL